MTPAQSQSPSSIYMMRILFVIVNMAYQAVPLWLMYHLHSGWPALLIVAFYFGFVPLFDYVSGDWTPDLEVADSNRFFKGLLYVQALFQFLMSVAAIALACSGLLPLWGSALCVLSIAFLNGQCPLIAHEFGHKLGRVNRMVSNFVCAIVGMGYFMPQHVRGHHIQVATPEDSASAKFGVSSYVFILKCWPAQIRGGFTREAERLKMRGSRVVSFENDVIVSYGITLIVAAVLVGWLGWQALPWIVLHHFIGWFSLMLNDYIQHYGLMRAMLPNGRREPASPAHSWNTDTPLSNLLLYNVQRHSHHHAQPMLPYQALRNMPTSPRLPTGYFGMMVIALLPPLWFRLMDHRVVAAAGGRSDRVNVAPSAHQRLERLLAAYAQPALGAGAEFVAAE